MSLDQATSTGAPPTNSLPAPIARRSILRAAVAAALVLLVVAGWLRFGRASFDAQAVRTAIAERRLPDAERLLAERLAARPDDGEALYLSAWLNLVAERPTRAVEDLRKAETAGYSAPEVEILKGVMTVKAGRPDTARAVLSRAFREGTGPTAEVAEAVARIHLTDFRIAEAAAAVEVWKRALPRDPRPLLFLDEIHERSGITESTRVENLRAALALDPSSLSTRLKVARLLLDTRELDQAEAEYRLVIEKAPDDLAANVGLGETAFLRGDFSEARLRLEHALKLDPREPATLRMLAKMEAQLGRNRQARDLYRRAVDVSPTDPELRYGLVRVLRVLGDAREADAQQAAIEKIKSDQARISELRKALVERPDDLELRLEAAAWLIEHGHDKEGLDWTALILKRRPGHPGTCRLLADYHERKGNPGLANYYRTAAIPAPNR